MKKFLVDAVWALAALVLAFLLWMAASPARAAEEDKFGLPMAECRAPECAMVPYPALLETQRRYNEMMKSKDEALARVKELEGKAPKCAAVEVTEPSKAPKLPPLPNDGSRKAS